jgi:hypothetical protein
MSVNCLVSVLKSQRNIPTIHTPKYLTIEEQIMKTLTNLKVAVIISILSLFNSAVYSQNNHEKPATKSSKMNKGAITLFLKKYTLSIGGGDISGSNYVVTSSVGQIDAGHITTGGDYQFIGGILAAPRNNQLFKDGFE